MSSNENSCICCICKEKILLNFSNSEFLKNFNLNYFILTEFSKVELDNKTFWILHKNCYQQFKIDFGIFKGSTQINLINTSLNHTNRKLKLKHGSIDQPSPNWQLNSLLSSIHKIK